ncbi:carbohydrate ABC transporter permease [Alicyclobacillus mali]|uniref:Carbohydrate ABC transporter permease n=1 Tax=Alicyclobacillus mali (ex Roth et al. 2021) TaxID=1123961 RepID=A0ABS0F1H6_9BACL|nr:carbohydrate ABC transporter permease [Alicyclobacillus mali (ex Roth et al. 2021)]MBF8377141.1 carbohydrate ABC transporter permease [Alicyclobacillus mali (ex Roth et al. 2021)]
MNIFYKYLKWAIIILFSAWTLFPLYWLVITSLKTNTEVLTDPPTFVPVHPTFASYYYVIGNFGVYFINSAIVSVGSTLLSLLIGVPAAYSLARFRFPSGFRTAVSFIVLSIRMMLPIVFIVPLFQIYQNTGLYNTKLGLIFAYSLVDMPFVVWMMRSYLMEIPESLDEAAMVDGCGRIRTMLRVVLPLAAPGLATTAVMTMIFTWNDLVFGLFLTANSSAETLPVSIIGFLSQYQTYWSQMAAAGVLAILPMVMFLLFVQKYLVRGLTAGAVK